MILCQASESKAEEAAPPPPVIPNYSWFLFHSIFAKFPESPSDLDKRAATNLLSSFADLYPSAAGQRTITEIISDPVKGHYEFNRDSLGKLLCDLEKAVAADGTAACDKDTSVGSFEDDTLWDGDAFSSGPAHFRAAIKSQEDLEQYQVSCCRRSLALQSGRLHYLDCPAEQRPSRHS